MMRRNHRFLAPLLVVIGCVTLAAQAARVAFDGINLRQKPSTDSAIVATVKKGAELQVLEKVGTWYRVRIKPSGPEGYINSIVVDVQDPATILSKRPETAPASQPPTPNSKGTTDPSTKAAGVKSIGKWKRMVGKSKMSNDKLIAFSLDAEHRVEGRSKTFRPTLVVRCFDGQPQVFVVMGRLEAEEMGRLRWDDGPPEDANWGLLTDADGFIAPQPVATAKKMVGAQLLRFEFKPLGAPYVVAEFRLDGFAKAAEELATSCDWSKDK